MTEFRLHVTAWKFHGYPFFAPAAILSTGEGTEMPMGTLRDRAESFARFPARKHVIRVIGMAIPGARVSAFHTVFTRK
jgi:hypothetical protein